MAKLESRIRELEIELGTVQSKTSETYKAFQKAERHIRNSNSKLMKTTRTKTACLSWPTSSKLRSRLTSKLRRLKSLLPSTWPSSKAQQELEEAEERSKMAGAALSYVRQASVM